MGFLHYVVLFRAWPRPLYLNHALVLKIRYKCIVSILNNRNLLLNPRVDITWTVLCLIGMHWVINICQSKYRVDFGMDWNEQYAAGLIS